MKFGLKDDIIHRIAGELAKCAPAELYFNLDEAAGIYKITNYRKLFFCN